MPSFCVDLEVLLGLGVAVSLLTPLLLLIQMCGGVFGIQKLPFISAAANVFCRSYSSIRLLFLSVT